MKSIADYELIEQLQPGNHGTFFKARTPERLGHDQNVVAVKILDRHATDNEFKRMAAELQLLLELDHPRIVEVLDAGHEGGRLYYVTRFYHEGGLPLGPASDPAMVVNLVADAAEAAHALHEVGVAHRDIKPSNILLANGRGHLSDLGVANYADANFTTTGSSPVGTLAYADPRLIHGDPAGRASDVWSLGATLHAALTGQSVLGEIPNVHLASAIEYVLSATVTVSPTCPPAVATVVAKATHAERPQRHLTGEELAADLRQIASQLSGGAAPPGRPPPPAAGGTSPLLASSAPPPPPASGQTPPPPPPAGLDLPTAPPLGVEGEATSAPEAAYQRPVFVSGQRSSPGHLNHPQATVCWVSGEARGSRGPWVPGQDERPPLGVLLFEDGRSYVLKWDTILGRQPDTDHRITSGQAGPLALEAELTMSRAHLHVELRDWDVYVTDISSNGTSLLSAATRQQRRLNPGEPTRLEHGDVLAIETLSVTFKSHHTVG